MGPTAHTAAGCATTYAGTDPPSPVWEASAATPMDPARPAA